MLWAWALVPTNPPGACGVSKEVPGGTEERGSVITRDHYAHTLAGHHAPGLSRSRARSGGIVAETRHR
eukprot:COSAG01_NODE_3468_length_6048_cov_100.676357_4_plen_68_part_00